MERCVALFISRRKGFFREEACINCSIDEFCACDGADVLFDIDSVMRKELVDVGQDVKMTEPLKVERKLSTEWDIFVSLSHKGILAICVNKRTVQFTDLNNYRQVGIKVENISLAAFYNNVILLLTWEKPLREARVEEVFDNPIIETFKEIEGTNGVISFTDVSLLHERRKLYYPTTDYKLFSFNVDTRENSDIDVGRKVWAVASVAGIDYGVKVLFQDLDDRCIYTLNNYNSVTKVDKGHYNWLTTLFPSSSNPKNISNAVFKYFGNLIKDGNKLDTSKLINFEYNYSVIRVYKDIFLAYDKKTESWVLLRIIAP